MILKERKTYYDFLRIIACFLVIFNHTPGYIAYQTAGTKFSCYIYMFFTMLTRVNVPIFFMISGALLLRKDSSYKELFCKRILRILGALFCASVIAYIAKERHNLADLTVQDFLRKFLRGDHSVAYWYLYAYLGFLVSLPLIRRIVKNMTRVDFAMILGIHFLLSTFIPIANFVLYRMGIQAFKLSSDFGVPLMTVKSFFYPIIGYYIDQVLRIEKLSYWKLLPFLGVCLFGILISSYMTYADGVVYGFTQDYVQLFDYLLAISMFLIVKYVFVTPNFISQSPFLNKSITLLGSLTFGIYLMEPILKNWIHRFDTIVTLDNRLLYSFSWCLSAMALCGLVTYGLKKIPGIKKLL